MKCGYDDCCTIPHEGPRCYCVKHGCSKKVKSVQARVRVWIKKQSSDDRDYLLWLIAY